MNRARVKTKKVLLLEHQPGNLADFHRCLDQEGTVVYVHSDLSEVQQRFQSEEIDLAILDTPYSGESGRGLWNWLREQTGATVLVVDPEVSHSQLMEQAKEILGRPNLELDPAEVEQAAAILRSLLPRRPKLGPHWELDYSWKPLSHGLGGDFVWIRPGLEHLQIALTDAAGHGICSSLLTSMLVEMLDGLKSVTSESVSRLNQRLCQKVPDTTSIAISLLEIDLSGGVFTLVNAGNPPCCVLGADRRALGETHPSMGWLSDYRYPVVRGELAPGEVLVLCSDGLDCEQLLVTEYEDCDELPQLCERVIKRASAQSRDDRTVLALRRSKNDPAGSHWPVSFQRMLRQLPRLRPSRLLHYGWTWSFPNRISRAQTPAKVLGELTPAQFLEHPSMQPILAALRAQGYTDFSLRMNTEQKKPSRSLQLLGRRRLQEVLLVIRSHLGEWTVRTPVTGERHHLEALFLDSILLGGTGLTLAEVVSAVSGVAGQSGRTMAAFPASFSEAVAYHQAGFRFLDPQDQGRFMAMRRDLVGPVEKVCHSLSRGEVWLCPERLPFRWSACEMLSSSSEKWQSYFRSPLYEKWRSSAQNLHHFELMEL